MAERIETMEAFELLVAERAPRAQLSTGLGHFCWFLDAVLEKAHVLVCGGRRGIYVSMGDEPDATEAFFEDPVAAANRVAELLEEHRGHG